MLVSISFNNELDKYYSTIVLTVSTGYYIHHI